MKSPIRLRVIQVPKGQEIYEDERFDENSTNWM